MFRIVRLAVWVAAEASSPALIEKVRTKVTSTLDARLIRFGTQVDF
jgi:hypothetical protein